MKATIAAARPKPVRCHASTGRWHRLLLSPRVIVLVLGLSIIGCGPRREDLGEILTDLPKSAAKSADGKERPVEGAGTVVAPKVAPTGPSDAPPR